MQVYQLNNNHNTFSIPPKMIFDLITSVIGTRSSESGAQIGTQLEGEWNANGTHLRIRSRRVPNAFSVGLFFISTVYSCNKNAYKMKKDPNVHNAVPLHNSFFSTVEPGSPTQTSAISNIGVLIGIVVAVTFVIVLAMVIFVTCFFYKRKQVETNKENVENNENTVYDDVLSPHIELPQLHRTASGYEQPSPYAQLDNSKRVPIDANYQSLKVENHSQLDRDSTLEISTLMIANKSSDVPVRI